MNLVEDLEQQVRRAKADLEQAVAGILAAQEKHAKAEEEFKAAAESDSKLDEFEAFSRLRMAIEHGAFLVRKAEDLRDRAAESLEKSEKALERARRSARVAELDKAGSVRAFLDATEQDAKVIARSLKAAREAAKRIDDRWSETNNAIAELHSLGAAHDDPSQHARIASVLDAFLEVNPGVVAVHGPPSYPPGVESVFDPVWSTIEYELKRKGISGMLGPELLRTISSDGSGRDRQLAKLRAPFKRYVPPTDEAPPEPALPSSRAGINAICTSRT